MRRQSEKAILRQSQLMNDKRAFIEGQIDYAGYSNCAMCEKKWYTVEDAMRGADWHHMKRRHHCDDTPENMMLLCRICHRAEHGGP